MSASNKWTNKMLLRSLKMEQLFKGLGVLSIIIVINTAATPAPVYDSVDFETYDTSDEYGDYEYYEGDTLLSQPQQEDLLPAGYGRNGLVDENKRWPNRTVVYHINEEDFDDTQTRGNNLLILQIVVPCENRSQDMGDNHDIQNEEQVSKIEDAFADIAYHSCITFRPRETDDEHAVIIQGSEGGCASTVGYNPDNGIPQYVKLADNCFGHGTLIHEIMHTLGFSHMQSTYDRDDYVDIVWENIIPGHEANFIKHSNESVSDFGVPYDYHSVMHYPDTAFTANGSQTVIPLKDNVTIGQREGLSHGDVLKLNRMYCEEAADEDKSVIDK